MNRNRTYALRIGDDEYEAMRKAFIKEPDQYISFAEYIRRMIFKGIECKGHW